MDLTAAKTFLAIVESGSFVAAAKRVHVTQSTVSARIKSLETEIGKPLFIRTKSQCELTSAGRQFHRYARIMLRAWEEARHQVAVPDDYRETLVVGGQYSLWNRFLLWWMPIFQTAAPHVALRAEAGMPARLMREMTEGVLDLAIIYNPELRPGLAVENIMEDKLILVSASGDENFQTNYVFIDWGEAFRHWHAAEHEALHNPGLTLDLGSIGINYLINQRGAGYFPERIVTPHLENGLLTRIKGAPVFPYPAYVVYQETFRAPSVMKTALQTLKETAEAAQTGALPPPYWV